MMLVKGCRSWSYHEKGFVVVVKVDMKVVAMNKGNRIKIDEGR